MSLKNLKRQTRHCRGRQPHGCAVGYPSVMYRLETAKWVPKENALSSRSVARQEAFRLSQKWTLQRFHNCLTPEPKLPSGFFIQKKPPLKMPQSAREL